METRTRKPVFPLLTSSRRTLATAFHSEGNSRLSYVPKNTTHFPQREIIEYVSSLSLFCFKAEDYYLAQLA